MNWIRVAVGIGDDPRIHAIADMLAVRIPEAVGLVVMLLCKFPEHAPDGALTEIPDASVERWSGWMGERGAFAKAIRFTFLDDAGVWVAWEKYNGAALREATAARQRMREVRRAKKANGSPDGSANGSPNGSGKNGASSPNGSPDGAPNGSADRSPDGTPLRNGRDVTDGTNERHDGEAARAAASAAPADGGLVHCFDDPAHIAAYLAYRRSHRMPDGLDAALKRLNAPLVGGAPLPWPLIGAALVEMRGASADFTPAAVGGFARRLQREAAAPPSPVTGTSRAVAMILERDAARQGAADA